MHPTPVISGFKISRCVNGSVVLKHHPSSRLYTPRQVLSPGLSPGVLSFRPLSGLQDGPISIKGSRLNISVKHNKLGGHNAEH